MPIKTCNKITYTSIVYVPQVRPEDNITQPITINQEQPDIIPENFDQLSKEEQERIKNRIRFRGIRARHDLKDDTITLNRETQDLP